MIDAATYYAAMAAWGALDLNGWIEERPNSLRFNAHTEGYGGRGRIMTELRENDGLLFIRLAEMPTSRHGLGTSLLHHMAPYLDGWGLDRIETHPRTRSGREWCRKQGFDLKPGAKEIVMLPLEDL